MRCGFITRQPTHELVSNWAYMVIATLAWNLKCWFALMMHQSTQIKAVR